MFIDTFLFQVRRLRAGGSVRVEVCPPAVMSSQDPLWTRLLRWISAPAPLQSAASALGGRRLQRTRDDFLACLRDIEDGKARALRQRLQAARTPRELWHLRSAVFQLVSLHHSQREALLRMDALNRHFPTRAPRSGFGAFDA